MRFSKVFKQVALGALAVAMVLSALPAHASGITPIIPDAPNDVIDFLKHTQNSFRPSTSPFPSPFTTYQKACRPDSLAQMATCAPFDLRSSQVSSDSTLQRLTLNLTTAGSIPARGAPLTTVPAPFTGVNYAWYFATTAQERSDVVGINCTGVAQPDGRIRDDFTVAGTGAGLKNGAEIVYTANSTCPGAANRDAESKGIGNGTTRPVLSRQNVMSVVHPKADGWLAFVQISMVASANLAKRLDGQGLLNCAGGAPVCIDYDLSVGMYEGYSGVSASNSMKDFDALAQPQMSFSVSGSSATATIPWNPTRIPGTDGDGVLDDQRSFPWPLAVAGRNDRLTQLTAVVSGVAGVGVNTVTQVGALCPDSTDNVVPDSVEPINTIGRTEGQANRTVGNATDDAIDATGLGTTDDDGIYAHGNGGTDHGDCIRGITGLLTILDWTDNGFELRIYPRNPGYLPGGVDCRYPIGERPLAVVLVSNVALGPMSAPVVDVNTSPFDKPYQVNVYANGSTPAQTVNGPVVADPLPAQNPLGSVIGRDKPCNYTYWAPGIHYFDTLADIPM